MRKMCVVSGAMLIVAFAVNAAQSQLIGAGFKMGTGFAKLQGSEVQTTDTRIGFAGGAYVNYGFSKFIAVQPEVLYVFKGAKFSEATQSYGTVEGQIIFDYVEIPILLKGMLPTTGIYKPYIFVGPALGILANAKIKVDTPPGYAPRSISEEVKSTDFSLTFGGGIDFVLPRGRITLDIRYDMGFSETFEQYVMYGFSQSDMFFTGDPDMKNSVILLMAGISFK